MSQGFFLTFEGLDGSGKTTQLKRLAAWLRQRGVEPVVTRQPGGTATGDKIRSLLLDARTQGLTPVAEMGLMFSDRAQAIAEVIAPALEKGQVVLCDRFTDSTEAYQGGGRRLGSELVLNMHKVMCGNLQPDMTILLLPNLDLSLTRARRRNLRAEENGTHEGRFEAEEAAFFERTMDKYREIAARDTDRVVTIEGGSIEEVQATILEHVNRRITARDIFKSQGCLHLN